MSSTTIPQPVQRPRYQLPPDDAFEGAVVTEIAYLKHNQPTQVIMFEDVDLKEAVQWTKKQMLMGRLSFTHMLIYGIEHSFTNTDPDMIWTYDSAAPPALVLGGTAHFDDADEFVGN